MSKLKTEQETIAAKLPQVVTFRQGMLLNRLLSEKVFPCISVLIPVHPVVSHRNVDTILLKNFIRQARKRLSQQLSDKDTATFINRLQWVVNSIDTSELQRGLAIFVSQNLAEKIHLPFPLQERLVIDDSFETSDIIRDLRRSIFYYVLVLSKDVARLFIANEQNISELADNGFPVIGDPVNVGGNRAMPWGIKTDRGIKDFYHFVYGAFEDVFWHNPLPTVLLGVEKDLGYFHTLLAPAVEEKTIAAAEGSYRDAPSGIIGTVAWTAIKEKLDREQYKLLEKLDAAFSADRVVSGISEAWIAAHEGKGDTLVVERHFHQAINNRGLGNRELPAHADDAVDDIAEVVIKKGGEVKFVNDGLLNSYQHIALILRY